MKAQRLPTEGLPPNWRFNQHRALVRDCTAAERASWEPVTGVVTYASGRKMPVTTYAKKPCQRCKTIFETQGYHNRLCHNCTTLVARRQDAGVFGGGVNFNGGDYKRRHGGS